MFMFMFIFFGIVLNCIVLYMCFSSISVAVWPFLAYLKWNSICRELNTKEQQLISRLLYKRRHFWNTKSGCESYAKLTRTNTLQNCKYATGKRYPNFHEPSIVTAILKHITYIIQPFYGHMHATCVIQHPLLKLEDFDGAKFSWPHAVAETSAFALGRTR